MTDCEIWIVSTNPPIGSRNTDCAEGSGHKEKGELKSEAVSYVKGGKCVEELQRTGVMVFVSAIVLVACMLYVTMPTWTCLPPPLDASEVGCLESVEIRVLIDNNPDGSLRSPWGISMHVTTGNFSLLFDAGPDPRALKENCERLGVNLTNLDTTVISHEHGDHVNGLGYVAEINEI